MKFTQSEPNSIKNLFDNIATNYDKLNFLMSFGLQNNIKRTAVKNSLKFIKHKPLRILDLCTGTGEIASIYKKYLPALLDGSKVSNEFENDLKEFCELDLKHLPDQCLLWEFLSGIKNKQFNLFSNKRS